MDDWRNLPEASGNPELPDALNCSSRLPRTLDRGMRTPLCSARGL